MLKLASVDDVDQVGGSLAQQAVALVEGRWGWEGRADWPDWISDERLAGDSGLPVDRFLFLLAHYPSVSAARRVAASEVASAEALRAVADYPDTQVLCTLIANPALPQDSLDQLSRHSTASVREAVAGTDQHALPQHLQEALAKDPHPRVRQRLATRSDTLPELLADLAEDPDLEVVRAAIANPALPMTTVETLLEKALGAPTAPKWLPDLLQAGPRYGNKVLIERIADIAHEHPGAWEAILGSANTPAPILESAARRRSRLKVDEAVALAENASTPPTSLARLGKDKRVSVLRALLAHPATPAPTIDTLTESSHSEIAALALGHPRCPLARLVPELTEARRIGAAGNPNTPGSTLTHWARLVGTTSASTSYAQRQHTSKLASALASNVSLPRQAWELLLQTCQHGIPAAVIRSELCPPDLLVQACMSKDYSMRIAASRNPACPDEGQAAAALMGRR